ncbi:hypothetical protein F7Q99_29190 [Streptomyces kaniharaensis]|uniref:Uncharacterized protein n=1 Tax=Streptomyces kaniharaensis TaxID=212423 RepID=A0A6N7KZE5_9ACTN|nr:hypothetical protein [Streptomyces kaniharaensis]MQS16195.1 hypothetical protein [Streptomyces kaniharaensis]
MSAVSRRRPTAYPEAGGILAGPVNRLGGEADPAFRLKVWLREQDRVPVGPLRPAAGASVDAWLTGRGLPRRGCDLASCESGTNVELDGECQACAYHVEGAQHRHAMRRQAERALAKARTTSAPAETHGRADQPKEQQLEAYCDRHVRTVLPCGLCVPLLDQPALPEVPRTIDGTELPPATVPAWMTEDNSEGIAFREQRAARRRERALAGSRS